MISVNITNDLKKILREKYNIQNITSSRLKAGFQIQMIIINTFMNYTIEKKKKNQMN